MVKIGSNIASLSAQRRVNETSTSLSKTFERLSSGMRINSASDDAAGLSIAESLRSDKRVYTQAIRNLNDGLSLLNIADGAIQQLSLVATRLKELAEQAANGVYGTKQRAALDSEAQALSREYFRIVQSTEFNDQKLFAGSFGELRLQTGYGIDGGIQSALGGAIGTGSFAGATSYVTQSTGSTSAYLGDLNGDGILDLVSAGSSGVSGSISVMLGTGSGTFGSSMSFAAMAGGNFNAATLGDINGDGILDLVAAGTTGADGFVEVRLGRGDGTFDVAISYGDPEQSYDVVLGDLNGDGVLDLVSTGNNSITTIRIGKGDGTFGAGTSFSDGLAAPSLKMSLGDIDGDGILDMVTTGFGGAIVRFGNGDGSFRAGASYTMGHIYSTDVTLRDINGDGVLDLIAAGQSGGNFGSATIRLGAGDGTFGSAMSYTTEGTASAAVALGDLNGDGILDLVTTGLAGAAGYTTVRLGSGDGSFGAAVSYAAESGSSADVALGDLDGDGVLDLVTTGTGGGSGRATVRLASVTTGISPLLEFRLTSRADALQALSQFTNTLNNLAEQRGIIGAFQSRVQFAAQNLQTITENLAAAASRITDVDVASESAELIRTQLLRQAAAAVLSQANQQPALALQLLT
ncbi:MAG: VCBS repeat-containing protein [Deltaproteobacteria bacterium]|nr:VCBS repeat-containing protein [Deltaproteobacteria bacterium]